MIPTVLCALALCAVACKDQKPAEQHARAGDDGAVAVPEQSATAQDPLAWERSLILGKTRLRMTRSTVYTKGGYFSWDKVFVCKAKEGKDLIRVDYEIWNDGDEALGSLKLDWRLEMPQGDPIKTSLRCPIALHRSFGADLPPGQSHKRSMLFEVPEGQRPKAIIYDGRSKAPAYFLPGPLEVVEGQPLPEGSKDADEARADEARP
jgi:hypothetical protein